MEGYKPKTLRDMNVELWNKVAARAKMEGLPLRVKVHDLFERYINQIDNLTNAVQFKPTRWWEIEREAKKRGMTPEAWVNETIALRLGEEYFP